MTITIASSNSTVKLTSADLNAFERALIEAAQQQNEREVNVKNARRGYILFGMWHHSYLDVTPEEFASGEVSLVLDGVAGIATL